MRSIRGMQSRERRCMQLALHAIGTACGIAEREGQAGIQQVSRTIAETYGTMLLYLNGVGSLMRQQHFVPNCQTATKLLQLMQKVCMARRIGLSPRVGREAITVCPSPAS